MQATRHQLPTEVLERLAAHQAARARFEAARDEADRIHADAQTQSQAAEAAEKEAQQARAEVALLLRKPGSSTREIHRLKANERAAYTLAEDYRAVVSEFQVAHSEAAQEAGYTKAQERSAYAALLTSYADSLMKHAEAVLEPLLHAMWVQERAYAYTGSQGPISSRDAALEDMCRLLAQRFKASQFDAECDELLQAAVRPVGLDRFNDLSPAGQHRDRVLREQITTQQS
ncbi:hypothetical protein AB6Q13_00745 [Ralstonia solanacearum]|uniref:hypothetical protein n=1 Tax=Ralstonia solanacearum TaxID=305 RepID=UPI0023063428|nr:hypothetical protein [Ralstonia solanacearum]MDB0564809.1 hypothetical protein [Ralstonia solanacearum]MDB0575498.1 hypothetical protein [Ralstonia solanacearum]